MPSGTGAPSKRRNRSRPGQTGLTHPASTPHFGRLPTSLLSFFGLVVAFALVLLASPCTAQSPASPNSTSRSASAASAVRADTSRISTDEPGATEIVREMDEHLRGNTQYAEMTMTVARPDWTRQVSLKSWMKGSQYTLILITAPARDEGTVYLKRGNEVWNWLPSVERVIKIPPSMMSQSWMGSDFTNDDLVKESSIVQDYSHELLGTEEEGGYECWKVDLTPKPDAAVVWGRVILWIAKALPIELRAEYYDEGGDLVNVMTLSDIQAMDGRKIPTILTMEPAEEEGHQTRLTMEQVDFNLEIPDEFFSQQNMRRVH